MRHALMLVFHSPHSHAISRSRSLCLLFPSLFVFAFPSVVCVPHPAWQYLDNITNVYKNATTMFITIWVGVLE
jgi:hypothetical protein